MRRDAREFILLLAEGCTYAAIATMTGCSSRTIALWKQRFAKNGLTGLAARHRGSKPTVLTPTLEGRIMAWTRRAPPHGATHWSTRSLGRKLGVQHTVIFTSVTDLRRKLMRYIKQYNKTAMPIRWSYADPSRRIA